MSKIADIFDETCETHSDSDAIYYYDKGLKKRTYGELKTDINCFINYLNSSGAKTGDSVFLFTPTSYKLVVFMIAAFKLGIKVLFLDINARQETFNLLFKRFNPKYLLVSNRTKILKPFFNELHRGLKVLNLDKVGNNCVSSNDLPKLADDTPALLTTTTGSTGMPKIIVRSHLDLYNQLELISKNLPKSKHSFMMSTSFIYDFAILARGDTVVLPHINLKSSPRNIDRHLKPFYGLPISIIITTPIFGLKAKNCFSKLTQLYIGGASINLQEAEIIQKKFSGSSIFLVYGATECNIMTKVTIKEYIRELRDNYRSTLGKPFDGVSIKIANDDSIIVSCNALIKGFVNEKSKYDTRDGDWYNTNDKGYIENGVLYYRGKYNYFITHNNKKYYSHEIEQFLSVKFPSYKKCAVLQKDGVVYLFGTERKYADTFAEALLQKYGFKPTFKHIRKLPYDIRHHTKIDYKKLLSLI